MKDDVLSAEQTRRELLAKMGTGLVAITVRTAFGQASPQEARAKGEAEAASDTVRRQAATLHSRHPPRHESVVGRVLTDAKGERATGVEYFDSAGERQEQMADVVVLSAYAFQNPRILLNSATDKHPEGLANASDVVGKYMMALMPASATIPLPADSFFL